MRDQLFDTSEFDKKSWAREQLRLAGEYREQYPVRSMLISMFTIGVYAFSARMGWKLGGRLFDRKDS